MIKYFFKTTLFLSILTACADQPMVKTFDMKDLNYSIIPSDSSERVMFVTPLKDSHLLVCFSNEDDASGDIVLSKVSADLSVVWEKNIGVPGFDFAFAGMITSDNSLVLSGFTTHRSAGSLDAYLVKVTIEGDTLWTRTIGGENDDRFIRVIETNDGNYIAVGQTNSWGNGNIDGFLVKMDPAGNEVWRTTIGDELLDRTYSVAQLNDGDLIVGGITNANYPDNSDILLVRLGEDGEMIWKKQTGGGQGDILHAMIQKDATSFVSIGYTAENSHPISDPLLVHFDENGDILGNYTLATGQEIRLMDGYFATDDLLITSGYIRDSIDAQWDVVVTKFDFTTKEFDISRLNLEPADDQIFHLAPFQDGTAFLAGHTENTPVQKSNSLLIRFDL